MRIFPIALIVVGAVGVLKHYGLVDAAFMQLLWPLLLIALGVAMLARGPRWRADMRERMQDRWERRMHRHFGPGWASLSDEERERFRAGMRQWRSQFRAGGEGSSSASAPAGGAVSRTSFTPPPAPGEQR